MRLRDYQSENSLSSKIPHSPYVARVLALYCSLPAVRRRFPTKDDIRLARELESASVPLVEIEIALLTGQLLRTKRDYEQGRLERLRSIKRLAYFVPLIKKARRQLPAVRGAITALAHRLKQLEPDWNPPVDFTNP